MTSVKWMGAVALAVTPALATPASAQLTLGNSDAVIGQSLARGGFERFEVLSRGIKDVQTQACRGNRMYRVRVNLLGKLDVEEDLGRCTLRRAAQAQTRPSFGNDALQPPAADRPQRDDQATRAIRRIGTSLSDRGYTRIRFERERAPFVVLACDRRNRQVRLTVTGNARIRGRNVLGPCRQANVPQPERSGFDVADLRALLTERGFDGIEVKRDRAPFIVEACRGARRFELVLDAEGQQQDRQRIGRCRAAVSEADLTAALAQAGLARIRITRQGDGFRAQACEGTTEIVARYDRFGERTARQEVGQCTSRSTLDVLTTLESRGASNTRLMVEGCFRGDRYRWSYDRYGERTGRSKIGTC